MRATLLRRSLLWRTLQLASSEETFEITYSGRGIGHESVYVNGELADRGSSGRWFVPVFTFPLGTRLGAIEVRVWPWLLIRSFHLLVEDEVVYEEGTREAVLQPGWANSIRKQWAKEAATCEEYLRNLLGTEAQEQSNH